MKSFYYDPKWRTATFSMDANNNPSPYIENDAYGRESKTYKLDAKATKIIRQAKEYHFMGQLMPGETIRLYSPNGGENITGGYCSIQWVANQTSVGANGVDLFYSSNNGSSWNAIASSVTGVSSYLWTIPAMVSNQCLIKVSSHDNGTTVKDQSDNVFTISNAFIITSPKNFDSWRTGTGHTVEWSNGVATITNVKIEFSTDEGNTWNTIASNAANAGSFVWRIPGLIPDNIQPSKVCKIRISSPDNVYSKVSDGLFEIAKASTFIRNKFSKRLLIERQ